jgi:hypothetical protein
MFVIITIIFKSTNKQTVQKKFDIENVHVIMIKDKDKRENNQQGEGGKRKCPK